MLSIRGFRAFGMTRIMYSEAKESRGIELGSAFCFHAGIPDRGLNHSIFRHPISNLVVQDYILRRVHDIGQFKL